MSGSRRPTRPFRALLVVLAVASTGCQLRLHVYVDVNRDGGGVLSVSVAADQELLDKAAAADADPLGDLVAAGEELGEGWAVSDTQEDSGDRTVTLRAPFENPEQLASLSAALSEAMAAEEADLLDPFTVTLTDETIGVEGAAQLQPTAAVKDYGWTPRRLVDLLKKSGAFEYSVAVTLPGGVTQTNGDQLARRVGWSVEPGERVELTASGPRPGPPWVRGLLGALGGGLVAAAVLWLLARRRRGGTA